MPFDGNNHVDGGIPLLTPYAYTPRAPATAIVPAYALHQAYNYSRAAKRLIGVQTYRETLLTALPDSGANTVNAAALTGIAEFRVVLPAHATYVFAEAHYSITEEQVTYESNHQILITDGGANTDTGSTATEEAQANGYANPVLVGAAGYGWYDFARGQRGRCFVERTQAETLPVTGVLTITVSAYAVLAGTSTPVAYKPHQILCWWEAL